MRFRVKPDIVKVFGSTAQDSPKVELLGLEQRVYYIEWTLTKWVLSHKQ